MAQKVNYTNKVPAVGTNPANWTDEMRISSGDMNSLKTVVNANADELTEVEQELSGKANISDIPGEIIGSIDFDSPKAYKNLAPFPFSSVDLPSATPGGAPVSDRVQLVEAKDMPGNVLNKYRPKGRGAKFTILATDDWSTPIVTGGTIRAGGKAFLPDPTSLPIDQWPLPVGSEIWTGRSIWIPSDFVHGTSGAQWMVISQLKGLFGGTAPIAVEISGQNFKIGGSRSNEGLIPSTLVPFVKGSWNRIEYGAFLSTSATEGWVELWINDTRILAKTAVSTVDIIEATGQPDPIYLKEEIYRPWSWKVNHTLVIGPVKVGTNHESVKELTPIVAYSKDLTNLATKEYLVSQGKFSANTRTVLFGNSLVAQSTGGTAQLSYQSFTFFPWLNQLLNGNLYLPVNGNQGVSGQTTAQMVARLGSAIALKPELTIIEASTNDLANVSESQIIANLYPPVEFKCNPSEKYD